MYNPQKLKQVLVEKAEELGFDVCRITDAKLPDATGERLQQSIQKKHHGSMQWMERTLDRRKSPVAMWGGAKSAILLGMNYGPDEDPLATLKMHDKATISVYARNRDYHDVIKGKLKTLASWLVSQTGEEVKVFVDTAPLMEKPLAMKAGLGWQGKHTNLVSREFGSWLFLGAILSATNLPVDRYEEDHCGSCRACLDICPTDAFPAPYQLDARKCISYLTIEHPGPIPRELRPKMGNRIYGCDDCLAVCPWNKYAKRTSEMKLQARSDLTAPDLSELASLDDAEFRSKFSGSPIKRIGRSKFLRNVMIAVGNSKVSGLEHLAKCNVADPDPLVRGASVWAFSKLADADLFSSIREAKLPSESDNQVRSEWEAGQ